MLIEMVGECKSFLNGLVALTIDRHWKIRGEVCDKFSINTIIHRLYSVLQLTLTAMASSSLVLARARVYGNLLTSVLPG